MKRSFGFDGSPWIAQFLQARRIRTRIRSVQEEDKDVGDH